MLEPVTPVIRVKNIKPRAAMLNISRTEIEQKVCPGELKIGRLLGTSYSLT